MMFFERLFSWSRAAGWLLACAPAAAAQTYTVVDLGHASTLSDGSYRATDVNLARQAVGQVSPFGAIIYPLLYEDGEATVLPLLPGFARGEALAINESGQMAGYVRMFTFPFTQKAVFWNQGAAAPPLDLGNTSVARDLNASGVVVGEATVIGSYRAAVWNGGATPAYLTALSGAFSTAFGVNAHNDVVGSSGLIGFGERATLWPAAGAPVELPTLTDGNASVAYAVNDARLAVGYSTDGTPPYELSAVRAARAVYWDASGAVHQLLNDPADRQSYAFDVNNHGEIVGTIQLYPHGNVTDNLAYLHNDGCGLITLSDLLPADAVFEELYEAHGINDRGDIVGVGRHATCCSQPHAFLMSRNDDAVGAVENPCGGVFTTDLIAGQNQLAGSVCVANDGVNLCVEYKANPGWSICETHMDIELEYTDFPLSRNGNPKIGQFSYQGEHPGGVSSVTYCIPLAEFGYEPGDLLLIAAHAAMCNGETAWGAGVDFTGNNWATYFTYEMQSCCE